MTLTIINADGQTFTQYVDGQVTFSTNGVPYYRTWTHAVVENSEVTRETFDITRMGPAVSGTPESDDLTISLNDDGTVSVSGALTAERGRVTYKNHELRR